MSYLLAHASRPPGHVAGHPADPRGTARAALSGAKLTPPPPRDGYVDRVRLRRVLDAWPEHRVTLVCAPAGYGKTTLAAAWARVQPAGTTAWLGLDPADRDPRRFWTYALAALRRTGALPHAAPGTPARDLLGTRDVLGALESLRRPVLLVLDDADVFAGSAAARSLALCLRYRGPLHLLLCSRIPGPLPVGRLLAAGDLAALERADLAFTDAEIVALAARSGVALSREQAAALGRRSEGWVAGLALALRAAHGRDPGTVAAALTGETGPVAAYLREEVLAGHPPQARTWLLRTSVLRRLEPGAVDAVAGDGPAMWQHLMAANAFVTVGSAVAQGSAVAEGAGGGARYHPLFHELLRHEAATQLADELPALHRRAAQWLVAHGDPVAAVEHAAAVPDWELVAGLAVRYAAPHLAGAHGDRLRGVLARLAAARPRPASPETAAALDLGSDPAPFVAERPGPDTGGPVAAAGALARAEHALRRADPVALLAACDRLDSATAGALAEPERARWDAAGYAELGGYHRAVADAWCGRLTRAGARLAATASGAAERGLHLAAARAAGDRALLLALAGRLGDAERAAIAAGRAAHDAGVPHPSGVLLALWLVRWLRGAPDHDDGYLAGARLAPPGDPGPLAVALVRARAGTTPGPVGVAAASAAPGGPPVPPFLVPWVAADAARELLAAGEPQAALRTVAPYLDAGATVTTAPAYLVAARAHLAMGGCRPAARLLDAVPSRLPDPGRPHPGGSHPDRPGVDRPGVDGSRVDGPDLDGPDLDARVTGRLLAALAADALGHEGAVRIALAEALAGAAGERLVRPLRAVGPAGQALLRRHHDLVEAQPALAGRVDPGGVPPLAGGTDDPAGAGPDGATRGVARGATGAATGGPAGLVEAVTEREGVVLRYLPTMLTTDDIAAELSVSRNTVKSQIRSIYRKLGVARRRDAVHRARLLDLI